MDEAQTNAAPAAAAPTRAEQFRAVLQAKADEIIAETNRATPSWDDVIDLIMSVAAPSGDT